MWCQRDTYREMGWERRRLGSATCNIKKDLEESSLSNITGGIIDSRKKGGPSLWGVKMKDRGGGENF